MLEGYEKAGIEDDPLGDLEPDEFVGGVVRDEGFPHPPDSSVELKDLNDVVAGEDEREHPAASGVDGEK